LQQHKKKKNNNNKENLKENNEFFITQLIFSNINNSFKTKLVIVILKKNLDIVTLKNKFIVKIKKLNKIFIKQFLTQIKFLTKITTIKKNYKFI